MQMHRVTSACTKKRPNTMAPDGTEIHRITLDESTCIRLSDIHCTAMPRLEDSWSVKQMMELAAIDGTYGYMVQIRGKDAGFALLLAAGEHAEILTIAVAPSFQRQGLANYIMQFVLADLKLARIEKCFLEVAIDNSAAQCLYARSGFIETHRRKGYYTRAAGTDVDAICMMRDIP